MTVGQISLSTTGELKQAWASASVLVVQARGWGYGTMALTIALLARQEAQAGSKGEVNV